MKRKLELRNINSGDHDRQRAFAHWCNSEYEVRQEKLAKDLRYITFWAQGSQGLWQGIVQPGQWIAGVLPQLLELLPGNVTDEDALSLFSAVEWPIEIGMELLDYNRLFEFALMDTAKLSCGELAVITTKQCPLWILTPPSKATHRQHSVQPWLQQLPLMLCCYLGTSMLTERQLRCLAPGDVVRIAVQANRSVVADRCVGSFTIVKEGVSMQYDTDSTNAMALEAPLADVTVKLEFVLMERSISLLELNELMTGTVLPLDSEVIRKIEVRVGGRALAMGELIQMDEHLGVELHEIFAETTL
ncbi:type III secretion protein Q [Pseudomonas sp. LAMO17WK12:I10]|uniref:FliM/FliN family flagellar motor switch protein n=1 Tax=unclassified Pseudomonas TaxID=196821 RepID=UPI000BC42CF8|nr:MULTISPECIES: FliM/FliN family flagellar motor switch protein [unclassified Pseudomonas]PXX53986.1 type III secretion protein Q [Pseudomonas sp. LAMO17WK12:I9]SNY51887.1 type III secretion protein Q [Pseudomonas sp. LAMO17WK12:I10]